MQSVYARECMFVCLSVCMCVCMCDTQNSMTTDTSYFGEKHDTVSHFRICVCVCVLIGKSKCEAGACEPRVNGDATSGTDSFSVSLFQL